MMSLCLSNGSILQFRNFVPKKLSLTYVLCGGGMYACTCFTVSHLKNLQGFLNLIYTVGSSSTGKIVSVNKTDNVVICFLFS